MADNQHFQYINKFLCFEGNLRQVKTLAKSLFLTSQRTLDLEYQDGDDELGYIVMLRARMLYSLI